MTKGIIVSSVVAAVVALGCSAETSDAGRDASDPSAKETNGADLPAARTPSSPEDQPAIAQPQPPSVLAWSFEPASADCNGWPVAGADAIRAAPARSGSYSCKVCANGSAPEIEIARELGAVEAGHYVFSAWVRKRVETAAPGEAKARVLADTAHGIVDVAANTVAVREEWDLLQVKLDLTAGASRVRVAIGAASDADRCLFVDDVSLTRE